MTSQDIDQNIAHLIIGLIVLVLIFIVLGSLVKLMIRWFKNYKLKRVTVQNASASGIPTPQPPKKTLSKSDLYGYTASYLGWYAASFIVVLISGVLLVDNPVTAESTFFTVLGSLYYSVYALYFIAIILLCIAVLWFTRSIKKSFIPLFLLIPLLTIITIAVKKETSLQDNRQSVQNQRLTSLSTQTIFSCSSTDSKDISEINVIYPYEGSYTASFGRADGFYGVYYIQESGNAKAHLIAGVPATSSPSEYFLTDPKVEYAKNLSVEATSTTPENNDYAAYLNTCKNTNGKTFSQVYTLNQAAEKNFIK